MNKAIREVTAVVFIPLTQGKVTVIDFEDYEKVRGMKWCVTKNGYAARSVWISGQDRGRTEYLHNLIMSTPKGLEVDHVDQNKLDNRRKNLRFATRRQNSQNIKKNFGGTSLFKGVSWNSERQKWVAQICIGGKQTCLGRFVKENEAAKAYDTAARKYFGEFACLNFNSL